MAIQASCLCGGVSLAVENLSDEMDACHCDMCRKWGGGPLLAVDCGQSLTIEGAALVSVFSTSDWAERGFCAQCGTHLFYRLKEAQIYHVPAGFFSAHSDFKLKKQLFVEEKPHYYDFANESRMMTGAEVFAEFVGDESSE